MILLNAECVSYGKSVATVEITVEESGAPSTYEFAVAWAYNGDPGRETEYVTVDIRNIRWLHGDEPDFDLIDHESDIEQAILEFVNDTRTN